MDDVFEQIKADKCIRIINSAFEEFGKNGYEKASTNEIVKNAEISKGLLFHYFGNKQELYNHLVKYAFKRIIDTLQHEIDWNQTDFFQRVKEIVCIKLKMIQDYPHIYEFLDTVMEDKTLAEAVKYSGSALNDLAHKAYSYQIDFSLFREDLDMDAVMNVIRWTFEKLSEECWQHKKIEDIAELETEWGRYIHLLRSLFYKR